MTDMDIQFRLGLHRHNCQSHSPRFLAYLYRIPQIIRPQHDIGKYFGLRNYLSPLRGAPGKAVGDATF